MAEQDRKCSPVAEFSPINVQGTVPGEEDGVDGEIDEMDEGEERSADEKADVLNSSPNNTKRVTSGKDSKDLRKLPITDRRRHHRHHHSNHRVRRQRTAGATVFDGEQYLFDEDWRLGGRPSSKRRLETVNDASSDLTAAAARLSYRKDNGRGYQQRSRQNVVEDLSESAELLESEDPLAQRYMKRITKGKRDHIRSSVPRVGDAEDGEILEDGELNDDEMVERKDDEDVGNKDSTEVLPSKLSSKEGMKGETNYRKKSDHRDRRKRECGNKIKQKKYTNVNKLGDESNATPAWGSGYQGPKPKASNSRHSQHGRGYHSPPGLYDSPSYSEESEEEAVPKILMTEGYIDASVAADEKEGIFNPKVSLGKKKKLAPEKNDRKRGRNLEGKYDGPPRKKPLVDLAMSERPACKFYLEGKCAKGSGCQFNHDVEKPRKMEVCKYHLTVKGCIKQRCIYMHEDFPCKYYHTGAKCYSGDRCKFSHDPLTEETRRALEMRVAAADIIDMEEPDEYEYEYRPRESHSRPSLLGSPPRHRQEVKKIPSLFEIEVHPPGQSPKPSHQAVSRPSGFYSESTNSPTPGVGLSGNSPNMGMINSSATMNQQGLSNQGSIVGPGLLQTPLRPSNIMGGPIGNNRPTMIMNIQQGLNNPQQRPCGGAPIQFLGPGTMNNNQQGGSLPPVLNMLGAIIREAAMQKGPGVSNNNMNVGPNGGIGPSNILQNMRNLGPGITIGPNNMQQGNMSIAPTSMAQNGMGNIMLPNNMGSMQASSTNNMGPLQNMMGLSNIMGNMGPNINVSPNDGIVGPVSAIGNETGIKNNIGIGQEIGIMDVDYRIKPEFGMEEANNDISELDKIRQQIQAQIDEEDEEEEEQEETDDNTKDSDESSMMQIKEEELSAVQADSLQEKEDDTTVVKADEVEHLEIPPDLPKKQRELFKRIQQQQLLREKERKRQEALKAAEETEAKADDDDWYSSDDDGESDKKPKLEDVLKSLNQKPAVGSSGMSPSTSGIFSSNSSGSSTASTLNIIQMINAIKSQTTSKSLAEGMETSSSKLSSTMNSHQQKETILSSPASPPPTPVSTTLKNVSSISTLHLPELTMEPPAVNAHPVKPLVYSVVKILLNMSKPYTQLPYNVNASDPALKDDPRIKWHLQHLEKQMQKAAQRKDSSDGERIQKKSDPRLQKGPSDPRLAKTGDSPDSRASDPRLQRAQVQSRSADPRLARQVHGNLDPRLGRQNSQNNSEGLFVSGPVNSIGSVLMNNMGGVMNNQIGGVMNQLGVSVNQFSGSLNSNPAGGLVHQIGSMNNLIGSVNNQSGGLGRSLQGGGGTVGSNTNMLGGPVNNIGGHINQIVGPFNQIGPGANQMVRLGGSQDPRSNMVGLGNINMIGGYMSNVIRGPTSQQNPAGNDLTMIDPWMNSSSVPGPGGQRLHNDPRSASDPRLKNRLTDPQEQRMYTKEPHPVNVRVQDDNVVKDSRICDDGSNNYRSLQANSRGHDDFREGPGYYHDDAPYFNNPGQINTSRVREECAPHSDHRIESSEYPQPTPSSKLSPPTQYSDTDGKLARKFDYRNDPRFKRVKRLAGAPKSRMDYSSPLSGEGVQRDFHDQDLSYNGNNHHNSSARDPRNRNASSPTLPDTLQDFDLPNSSALTVQEPEIDLKVKDLFKTIDPTASPFC